MVDLGSVLAGLLAAEVFAFLLVFTRIGAALMVLPGIGDGFVPPRIRLLLALLLAFLVTPPLAGSLPGAPDQPVMLATLLAGEVVTGLFLGLVARLLMTAVDVAGTIIAYSLSLANAQFFNPAMAGQGSLPSAFLTMLGLVLLFVTNLHHLMIMAVVDSYSVFPAGDWLPIGDAADMISRLVARSFMIGVQMAAPFIAIGLIFYLGLGLLARLMPQVQIFFIAIPIQVMLGTAMLALTLSAIMLYWLRGFEDSLIGFLAPG
jgi:flagellar biosynthetic protein FliR